MSASQCGGQRAQEVGGGSPVLEEVAEGVLFIERRDDRRTIVLGMKDTASGFISTRHLPTPTLRRLCGVPTLWISRHS